MPLDDSPQLGFIPVLRVIVNYDLKLSITTKVGYLEDPLCISVVHDPLLDQDSLIQPASDFEERSWHRFHPNSPAPPRIARSSQAEEILSIPTQAKIIDARLIIIIDDKKIPAFDGRLIKHVSSKLIGRGNQVLGAVLNAAISLPVWDNDAKSADLSNQAMIAVCISDSLAAALGQNTSSRLAEAPRQILFRERKVEASHA